jgi:hypothetical protein
MMKNFTYNSNVNKERMRRTLQVIKDFKPSLIKKFGGDKFLFICDYPFVLKYPCGEIQLPELCNKCGTETGAGSNVITWEAGFRPKIHQITIDLEKISPILIEAEKIIRSRVTSSIIKRRFKLFVHSFKKSFA